VRAIQDAFNGTARARRFDLQLPVRFRPLGQAEWREARTENISCTGVLFRSEERLEVSRPVELVLVLEVDVEGEKSPEVICLGNVARQVTPNQSVAESGLAVRISDYHFPGEPRIEHA